MQIISHETHELDNRFTVQIDRNRQAYLVVRRKSHPLRVAAAFANIGTGNFKGEINAAVDEASSWLLEEIRQGRVVLK
jgi:hypothetical protein